MDTIIALSSGSVPSGVAVLRVSGPLASLLVASWAGAIPEPRKAVLRHLRTADGEIIDQGLVLWFPAPGSFTGEDCAEFHVHGSRAVIEALLDDATAKQGVRLAEAGEFALRAFSNGKLDLTAAEGLADLVNAETQAQRRFARMQAAGGLNQLYEGWRARLLHGRAMIEAEIDFADEDDVPGSVSATIWSDMDALRKEIASHVGDRKRGEIQRDGFHVALVGPPNAGKSTLLNRLARSEKAIVSPEPGTTRDVVEARLDLGGFLVHMADTAGLRVEADTIEIEGIRRARKRADEADLVLYLDQDGKFDEAGLAGRDNVWLIRSKSDEVSAEHEKAGSSDVEPRLAISGKTGHNLNALEAAIVEEIARQVGVVGDVVPSRARHAGHLMRAEAALAEALDGTAALEIRAEAMRVASHELGRVTGAIDVEDILGAVFASFCVGK